MHRGSEDGLASDSSAEGVDEPDTTSNIPWATVPNLVVTPGTDVPPLTSQVKPVREIVGRVINKIDYYLAFKDGFPETGIKGMLSKKLLLRSAKYLGYQPFAQRLQADPDYANLLARIVSDVHILCSL